MSATVETLENLQRKIVVSVSWLDINEATDKELKNAQKRVKVDGFRPGKAPLKMVAQMYGASIQNDVLNDLAQQAFNKEAQEQNLRIAAVVGIEPVQGEANEDSFKVAFIYETFPEITIADLSALEIEKVSSEVGDKEVDSTIEILRKQRTRFNRVEREAKNDDRVIIDFEGKIDGVAFDGGSSTNYPFVLGQGQMLPEFEAGVIGLKEGESKDVEVNFPEDYHGKDVAGKTAVFTITVRNVAEPELPVVDEQFAKALGITDGDVAKMREEVKKNVGREVKRRVDAQNTDAVMNALRAAHTFDLPKAFVADESQRLAEEMKQQFAQQGLDAKDLELPAEMFAEHAEQRVALGLLLPALVEEFKLQATDEQVKAIVADFADSYEDPTEVIDWYFADRTRLAGPTNLAVEANVVEYVLSKAKVTEKALSFDEVMGANA
ncbi:trigger factor [Kingella negevensis]|uniref:trigger factor n=1 Tax=Kingella negevensis TaxID=1522312 RepID=UPI002542ED8D|nr:trigger factor [Kingella negevensis]MDK4679775.1 trigger factor [Kingella negevensis]MDK4682507.1 trigger factor [Kingella negevensis]MDK4690703.1 trigger factor [Kingella negevensis]MDK4694149.1 trigger factor [Kingella negevensis]MDK4699878.1 trigger factor [Kingella negevensis]